MNNMLRKTVVGLALAAWLAGCTYMVPVKSTEAYSVGDCTYVGTFEEINDPGRISFGTLKHYLDTTTVEFRVKMRAYSTGATHLVWLYNQSESAGAMAYNCPDGDPSGALRIDGDRL
jgi:hypothetical protein